MSQQLHQSLKFKQPPNLTLCAKQNGFKLHSFYRIRMTPKNASTPERLEENILKTNLNYSTLYNLLFPPPKSSYSSFRPNKSPQATQLGIGDFPRSKKGQGTSNGSSNFPWRMRAAISSQFPLGCRRRLKSQKYYSQVYNVFAIIAKLPFGTWFKYLKTLCFNATCWYAGFQVCQGL